MALQALVFDAYGSTDLAAVGVFAGGMALAYALGGFSNFFLRRPFVSDAVFSLVVMVTVAAFLIFQFTEQRQTVGEMARANPSIRCANAVNRFAYE